MDVTIFHQRAEQWRQQLLAVRVIAATARPAIKSAVSSRIRRIHRQAPAGRDPLRRGLFPIAQQEDRHVLLALMKLTDQFLTF